MMYNTYWPVIQGHTKDNQKDRLSHGSEAQDQSIIADTDNFQEQDSLGCEGKNLDCWTH